MADFSPPSPWTPHKTDGWIRDAFPLCPCLTSPLTVVLPDLDAAHLPDETSTTSLLCAAASDTQEPPHARSAAAWQNGQSRHAAAGFPTEQRLLLVDTLHRGHGLALLLVEGGANDAAVREVDLAVRRLLPAEGVLHPVHVVAVGVVLAGVGATRLLAVRGRGGSLGAVSRSSASWLHTHSRALRKLLTRK